MDRELLEETKTKLNATREKNSVLFQYDTIFTLKGIFCSTLSYIHPLIAKSNLNISLDNQSSFISSPNGPAECAGNS